MAGKKSMKDFSEAWSNVLIKTWMDKQFKEKLLKNPNETLKQVAPEIFEFYKEVKIHDYSNDSALHLNLISPPSKVDLTEKDLEKISGGQQCGEGC